MKAFLALFSVVLAVLGFGCGKATGPSDGLRLEMGRGQIKEIYYNDKAVFRGTGGYYIIGNCPGSGGDGPDNVASFLDRGDGKMSSTTGHCQDVPYSLAARVDESGQTIIVDIEIGPVPPSYGFSLPFDAAKSVIDRFEFGGAAGYQVGCANIWSGRGGSGGYFRDISAPCTIDVGNVGAARTFSASHLEISGSEMKIRRTIISGGAREFLFYNHPGTNNSELGLCCASYYRIREEISFSAN